MRKAAGPATILVALDRLLPRALQGVDCPQTGKQKAEAPAAPVKKG
jgi:hypothetical protein